MPQTTDTDKCSKSRSDEESINFRPSPNFKHMKKYLKSKFEEANQNAGNDTTEPATSPNMNNKEENKQTPKAIQPPLPPNPPPDDLPIIKKEIEDEEYNPQMVQTKQFLTEFNTESGPSGKPNETMCRNYIRGTCKRGASCIFVHRLILSQLPSVYTFCKDFQNTTCTYAKCKFVHATVFEKEYFYRTGYLPPHTLSHLKEVNLLQQPPPPSNHPPPPPPEKLPVVPPMFTNPPPPPLHPPVAPTPVITCVPTATIDARTDIFKTPVAPATASLKREWSDVTNSPRDFESSEPLSKKCKNCDNNEFRLQYTKDKVKKLSRNSLEMNKKIALINEKNNRLRAVFELLKSKSSIIGGDKEKNLMDKLSSILA